MDFSGKLIGAIMQWNVNGFYTIARFCIEASRGNGDQVHQCREIGELVRLCKDCLLKKRADMMPRCMRKLCPHGACKRKSWLRLGVSTSPILCVKMLEAEAAQRQQGIMDYQNHSLHVYLNCTYVSELNSLLSGSDRASLSSRPLSEDIAKRQDNSSCNNLYDFEVLYGVNKAFLKRPRFRKQINMLLSKWDAMICDALKNVLERTKKTQSVAA